MTAFWRRSKMFRRERSRSDVFALEIAKKHLSLLYKSSFHFTNILFMVIVPHKRTFKVRKIGLYQLSAARWWFRYFVFRCSHFADVCQREKCWKLASPQKKKPELASVSYSCLLVPQKWEKCWKSALLQKKNARTRQRFIFMPFSSRKVQYLKSDFGFVMSSTYGPHWDCWGGLR